MTVDGSMIPCDLCERCIALPERDPSPLIPFLTIPLRATGGQESGVRRRRTVATSDIGMHYARCARSSLSCQSIRRGPRRGAPNVSL